ncbi:MAG: toll/interleukin-1 receptor domain-containing protein [Promethearchaeota archaeon]
MDYIDHTEEIFYTSKQIPNNPDSFFKYFINQLQGKKTNIQQTQIEFSEVGPREKLSTKFELIGLINSTCVFSIRFDIKDNKTDVYYGFKIELFGLYEKKLQKKILKKSYKHNDQLYGSIITSNVRSLIDRSIKYTNDLVEPPSTPVKAEQDVEGRGILVFISYATVDEPIYKIKHFAEELTKLPEIFDVLYWQEDMKDNIVEYMSDNLGKCDVVVLFCSPNSLDSEPVKKEWTAADSMNKPIIPIFKNPEHIPPLLRSRLGIQFDDFAFEDNVKKIYELITKKIQK